MEERKSFALVDRWAMNHGARMSERFWIGRARATMFRQNAACWLAGALSAVWVAATLVSVGLVFVRQAGGVPVWFTFGAIAAFGFAIAWGWYKARGTFYSLNDSLVRLDRALGLHNRLVSAAAGIGDFPPARPDAGDGFHWRWRKIIPPLAISILAVAVALWVPIPDREAVSTPREQPSSWTQVETWTEQLGEADLVEPESIETLEESLDSLRNQSVEQWFMFDWLANGYRDDPNTSRTNTPTTIVNWLERIP